MTDDLHGGGPAPLYVRLKEALRRDIAARLKPGDLIPSEQALIERYGVSRTTVRLALGALANEGLIVRKQGRGSFVSEPKKTVAHSAALLGEELPALTESTLVSVESTEVDARTSAGLRLAEGSEICRIRWIDRRDGLIESYRVSYLPALVNSHIPAGVQTVESIRRGIKSFRLEVAAREDSVEVVLADPFRASMLRVTEGAPLLLVEGIVSNASGTPLELNRSFYSGHSVRVQLNPESIHSSV